MSAPSIVRSGGSGMPAIVQTVAKMSVPITGDAADRTRSDVARPADHSGYAYAPFVTVALPAAQAAGRASVSVGLRAGVLSVGLAGSFRAIVRREEHDRVAGEAQFVERRHQPAERVVELRDVAMVLPQTDVGRVGVLRHEARVRLDRQVRLVRPDVEVEWLRRITPVTQPFDRLGDDQRRGVALQAGRPARRCGRSWSGPCGLGRRCFGSRANSRSRGRSAADAWAS